MRVLAIDTAISTGVAIASPGEPVHAFAVSLGKAEWDLRFARMLRLVERYVTQFSPDLVAVEAPAAGGYQNLDLIGLTVCARAQAARMGVKTLVCHPQQIRKHFLGKAYTSRDFPHLSRAHAKKAIKGLVIDRCRLLGWTVEGDDAADAAAMADFALAKSKFQVAPGGELFVGGRG